MLNALQVFIYTAIFHVLDVLLKAESQTGNDRVTR